MKNLLNTLFLAFSVSGPLFSQDQNPSFDDLVSVTYATSPKGKTPKELKNARIQILYTGDSVELWGFNLSALPAIKKFKAQNPKDRISRNEIRSSALWSLDSIYQLLADTTNGFHAKLPVKGYYEVGRDRLLKGKKSTPYFSNQWIKLGSIYAKNVNKDELKFRVKRFFHEPVFFQTEQLPGAVAFKLPALDPWNCVPASERYFKLRKLQGYGLDKFKYETYKTVKRTTIRKKFEIAFEKNQSSPDPAGLQEVIDYLVKNDYVILQADMEGATSIEGTQARNEHLQRERAKVMANALKRYNNDPVKSETVVFRDMWYEFRSQIRDTNLAWLDTLSNEAILGHLNKNDSLSNVLEPMLRTQRRAQLRLVMAKIISKDEQFIKLSDDLTRLTSKVFRGNARDVDKTTEEVSWVFWLTSLINTWKGRSARPKS